MAFIRYNSISSFNRFNPLDHSITSFELTFLLKDDTCRIEISSKINFRSKHFSIRDVLIFFLLQLEIVELLCYYCYFPLI